MLTLRYVVVTPPADEPVSLADVRAHLRIDDDDTSQDALLNLLISSARRYAELYTGRSFMTQTIRAIADRFPGGILPPQASPFMLPNGSPVGLFADTSSAYVSSWEDAFFELRCGPVQSVQSIQYLDVNGVQQTLSPSAYVFDPSGLVPRIAPAYGVPWPVAQQQVAAVQVTLTAGYGGSATDVPATIRNWILVRVATAYGHREEEEVALRGQVLQPSYIDGLLDAESVVRL